METACVEVVTSQRITLTHLEIQLLFFPPKKKTINFGSAGPNPQPGEGFGEGEDSGGSIGVSASSASVLAGVFVIP